jgi:hypothetical protein
MKVLVCGGRDFQDWKRFKSVLDILHVKLGFNLIISGGARGADTFAILWAKTNNIECKIFYADWMSYGKRAGLIRNQKMLDVGKPDLVIAFPGGKGTEDMISRAKNEGMFVKRA